MHRTESISGRQLPQSERPRGRREVCCVPETPSCATPSYSPAGSPVTSYNRKALTPSSERQKAMVLGPTNWLSEEMRGWVNKGKDEWCGKWRAQASINCFMCFFFHPLQDLQVDKSRRISPTYFWWFILLLAAKKLRLIYISIFAMCSSEVEHIPLMIINETSLQLASFVLV